MPDLDLAELAESILLAALPAQLPKRASGKPFAMRSIERWVSGGKLSVIHVGGARFVTRSTLADFLRGDQQSGPQRRTNRQRQASVARAAKELEAAGI